MGGIECPLIDLGPPPVYATVPPGTPGSITDDLGNVCLGPGISRTFYENSPGEVKGVEVEVTLGADRRAAVQRRVRVDRLGIA